LYPHPTLILNQGIAQVFEVNILWASAVLAIFDPESRPNHARFAHARLCHCV